MKYTVLHRENNNFKDILSDPVIKKAIRTKLSFDKFLILELDDEQNVSYLIIKYGDDVVSLSHIIPDRTPIPNKDYVPEGKKSLRYLSRSLKPEK